MMAWQWNWDEREPVLAACILSVQSGVSTVNLAAVSSGLMGVFSFNLQRCSDCDSFSIDKLVRRSVYIDRFESSWNS